MNSAWLALTSGLLVACGTALDKKVQEEKATVAVKANIATELEKLLAGAKAMQAAAPAPDANGWNRTDDAAAVAALENAWKTTRVSYEKIEGAIAVLFDGLDVSTDQRYDFFVETQPDNNLFDDTVVTGMHGIERILWSDRQPPRVVAFEQGLTHFKAAAFPSTQAEADDFKNKLCKKLVDDVQKMKDDFAPLALDASTAFRGVIGSMEEQAEKTHLASTGEEESRYSQHTLADMRANLEGGLVSYGAFASWLKQEKGGTDLDAKIRAAFAKVKAKYDSISGDAIPEVPEDFDPQNETSLATPYGQLYTLVEDEANPERNGSLVNLMTQAADLLKIPQLPE